MVATGFEALLPACPFNQDPSHRLGGRGKEVPASVPALLLSPVHQSDVRLVDQRGCLQRLARLLVGKLLGGQLPQLS